jgi:serine/threonine protein kinase
MAHLIGKRIGKGKFGDVFIHTSNSNHVVKRLLNKNAETELEIFAKMDPHPNVIRMITSCKSGLYTYLVFPRYDMDLHEYVQKHPKGLDSIVAAQILVHVLAGLECLHDQGIIHRDIKPDNILLVRSSLHAVISDLGWATRDTIREDAKPCAIMYRAPEIMDENGYNAKIDVWALGCVYAEMRLGSPLFLGADTEDKLQAKHDAMYIEELCLHMDVQEHRNWARMMEKPPKKRTSAGFSYIVWSDYLSSTLSSFII